MTDCRGISNQPLTHPKSHMKTLKDLFLDGLADMYDAEQRIVKALPKMAKAATSDALKEAIQSHLKETEGHVNKLEEVFQSFDTKAKGKTCEATVGLLKEGDEIAAEFKGSPAINAALISAAQKVEHYEMVSYGCLHEWAGLLNNQKAATLLQQILEQEKHANTALNELAHSSINEEALGESQGSGSQDDSADERPGDRSAKIRPVATSRSPGLSAKR